ncbi:MAG: hypothetical protein ACREQA_01965 [Candidatus Binatia bacterium]
MQGCKRPITEGTATAQDLPPGEIWTVTVQFAPTSEGAKNATLQFISNDPDENPKDVPLSGTGATDKWH